MRAILASLLTACVVGTAFPLRAQEAGGVDRPPVAEAGGPLAQSGARAAARLAAFPEWSSDVTATPEDSAGRPGALELTWSELSPVIAGRTITFIVPGGASLTGEVVTVRDDALLLEIKKTSDKVAFPGSSATIPRESITELTVERRRGSWGRNIGTTIGVLTGVVVGGYVAGTVADSAGTGIPMFLAIASGITVGGYYAGRELDTRRTMIRVVP
jgi:hypothetical protein